MSTVRYDIPCINLSTLSTNFSKKTNFKKSPFNLIFAPKSQFISNNSNKAVIQTNKVKRITLSYRLMKKKYTIAYRSKKPYSVFLFN